MTLRNYSSTAAATTLSAPADASTTTLTVSATTGFPAAPFILAIDADAAGQELVLVTNVAGTILTVTRAYDSTVASAHSVGAAVAHSHAGLDFREANVHVNATSGVHGRTGSVVGTTDTQTLTNKTVALGNNTVTGTKAEANAALTDGDFLFASDIPLTAWTSYTPTMVGGTAGTGATFTGGYRQVGRVTHFWARVVLGTTPVPAAGVGLTLPVTAAGARGVAAASYTDTGTTSYAAHPVWAVGSVGTFVIGTNGTVVSTSATVPFTWASGDIIEVAGTYEAA